MSKRSRNVTVVGKKESKVPAQYTQGMVLLEWLRERKVLNLIGERLHVQRQGGYPALDAFI